ncbi:hypothetical protein ACLKA7_003832 [Drosophila subpalustris]
MGGLAGPVLMNNKANNLSASQPPNKPTKSPAEVDGNGGMNGCEVSPSLTHVDEWLGRWTTCLVYGHAWSQTQPQHTHKQTPTRNWQRGEDHAPDSVAL